MVQEMACGDRDNLPCAGPVVKGSPAPPVRLTPTVQVGILPDVGRNPPFRWTRDPAGTMTRSCPCCGLALTQAAARCPLCNERLNTFHLRARHYLTALLALEICVALVVLT